MKWKTKLLTCIVPVVVPFSASAQSPDPKSLVADALDHWRGETSYTRVEMTIHRPDWQRRLRFKAWTRGREDSLVRFTAPPADKGNAVLKLADRMWVFNPKLNRTTNLPISMLSQSWMGSDFSYNDLAKSDQIIDDYKHKLKDTLQRNGHTVYVVEARPKSGAPVVWGKQEITVRDDDVLLKRTYFDQDQKPVRTLKTRKVAPLDGRPYPVVMRMQPADKQNTWTELRYKQGNFNLALPEFLFTRSNLSNPRRWSPS